LLEEEGLVERKIIVGAILYLPWRLEVSAGLENNCLEEKCFIMACLVLCVQLTYHMCRRPQDSLALWERTAGGHR